MDDKKRWNNNDRWTKIDENRWKCSGEIVSMRLDIDDKNRWNNNDEKVVVDETKYRWQKSWKQ